MTIKVNMKPEHPGGVILNWILPEGMTITEAAKRLGVSRQSLDALVNERRSVSPEMAKRLELTFGGTARTLLNCLLYTSPSPRDATLSRMPSSA